MSVHEAGAQMLGYLYQVRLALYLLLNNEDPSAMISIEKFDDIAFESNGTPYELIQMKHHTTNLGDLTDKSVDLWRTFKSWIDTISNDLTILEHTNFIIITTACVPAGSAAEKINQGENEVAYSLLKKVAEDKKNKSNALFYNAFLNQEASKIKTLLSKAKIIGSSSNISDVRDDIKKVIRYSCKHEHIDYVTDRVEGWWFNEVIKALLSNNSVLISQGMLQNKIIEISRQYDDDNLPIEFWNLDSIEEKDLDTKDRLFLEQLRLISSSNNTLKIAIRDYYRASVQRSSWLRKGLIFANELDSYENRLKDAWERAFAAMEENLSEYGEPTEDEKIREGRALYRNVTGQDIRIRDKCEAPYVMHGTYHIMSNALDIGWHIDFIKRIKQIMEG